MENVPDVARSLAITTKHGRLTAMAQNTRKRRSTVRIWINPKERKAFMKDLEYIRSIV